MEHGFHWLHAHLHLNTPLPVAHPLRIPKEAVQGLSGKPFSLIIHGKSPGCSELLCWFPPHIQWPHKQHSSHPRFSLFPQKEVIPFWWPQPWTIHRISLQSYFPAANQTNQGNKAGSPTDDLSAFKATSNLECKPLEAHSVCVLFT